jgi:bisphosphoglycerate-independent phosphoglycerate mutase (AlkP superfamily)
MIEDSDHKQDKKGAVVLLFIDGFGIDIIGEVNAISTAKPKYFNSLVKDYPIALLKSDSRDFRKRYWSLGTGEKIENFPQANTCLSQIIADNNLRQLKISSAYNYNLVNYLFNNLKEEKFLNEDRIMVGEGEVDIYGDAKEIIKVSQKAINENIHDLILINLPILDQLSKQVDFKEIVKGVKVLDEYIKRISQEIISQSGVLVITSAYGHAEYTKDLSTDWLNKEATNNPVPLILVANEFLGKSIGLADPIDDDLSLISPIGDLDVFLPTILKILNIKISDDLNLKSLI